MLNQKGMVDQDHNILNMTKLTKMIKIYFIILKKIFRRKLIILNFNILLEEIK